MYKCALRGCCPSLGSVRSLRSPRQPALHQSSREVGFSASLAAAAGCRGVRSPVVGLLVLAPPRGALCSPLSPLGILDNVRRGGFLVAGPLAGRVAFRGCGFTPSPSGRSRLCSLVRRRGASFQSSGRASPLTAGLCFQLVNPSAVAPFASGVIGRQSSHHAKRAANIGQPSESYPPNKRRQNGAAVGCAFGSGWWVKSIVACCRQWSACCRSRSSCSRKSSFSRLKKAVSRSFPLVRVCSL